MLHDQEKTLNGMQTIILWTGREYYSLEHCVVASDSEGTTINSVIIGQYQGILYRVAYHIKTNANWETLFCEIDSSQNDSVQHQLLETDGIGNWKLNHQPAPGLTGCIDIDLPLTPFTNSLPINRLRLSTGQQQKIDVVYIDLMAQHITPVQQLYHCITPHQFHYENIPNDFEADIIVNDDGFVMDYPSLFSQTSIHKK